MQRHLVVEGFVFYRVGWFALCSAS